ncbi:MAG: hypothetical protein ACRYFS_24455 [Janthinobacterium lividum]
MTEIIHCNRKEVASYWCPPIKDQPLRKWTDGVLFRVYCCQYPGAEPFWEIWHAAKQGADACLTEGGDPFYQEPTDTEALKMIEKYLYL